MDWFIDWLMIDWILRQSHLCSPGWPRTFYGEQASKLWCSPSLRSIVRKSHVCATKPGQYLGVAFFGLSIFWQRVGIEPWILARWEAAVLMSSVTALRASLECRAAFHKWLETTVREAVHPRMCYVLVKMCFICIRIWLTWVCVCFVCLWCLRRSAEGVKCFGTGVIESSELLGTEVEPSGRAVSIEPSFQPL